jgi:hypothetical protein
VSGAASLQAFRATPAGYADPALAADLIVPGLRADTAERVLRAPRTAGRAGALLLALLPEADPAGLEADDARLVLASPAALDSVGLAAGAVWHGKRVRALVRGAEIAALAAACGPTARASALRHAPPVEPVQASADLLDDIRREAVACVTAWCASLPDWAAARMRLVRPAAPPPDHAGTRAGLMRALSREVLA